MSPDQKVMIQKIRVLRDEIRVLNREDGDLLIQGYLPNGQDMSPEPDEYVDAMEELHSEGLISDEVLREAYEVRIPEAVIQLFAESCAPRTGSIALDTSFQKAEILDSDGEVVDFDKHLLKLGRIEENELVVDATTGEIILSDVHYWQYNEPNSTRVLADDFVTFFNEYMAGSKYLKFSYEDDYDDEITWQDLLKRVEFS